MKDKSFTFRISEDELENLEWLSFRLMRSQSDSIRWLIMQACHRYGIHKTKPKKKDPNPIQLTLLSLHEKDDPESRE